jgi:hypothetical protein
MTIPMSASPARDNSGLTNIRFRELDCPRIGLTPTDEWRGAAALATRGKDGLRKFADHNTRFPAAGSDDERDLAAAIDELVGYWREEIEAGLLDRKELAGDSERYDQADRIVIGWLDGDGAPELHEAVLQLAWPDLLKRCSEFAAENLGGAEEREEKEELDHFRIRAWLQASNPFASQEWLSRGALFSSFEEWSRMTGHPVGKAHDFYAGLEEVGCQPGKRRGDRGYHAPRS